MKWTEANKSEKIQLRFIVLLKVIHEHGIEIYRIGHHICQAWINLRKMIPPVKQNGKIKYCSAKKIKEQTTDHIQLGTTLSSSISNKRVLSIRPWFLRTKSRALWPWRINNNQHFARSLLMNLIQTYWECCRSGTEFVVVVIGISQFGRYYYPAMLLNYK